MALRPTPTALRPNLVGVLFRARHTSHRHLAVFHTAASLRTDAHPTRSPSTGLTTPAPKSSSPSLQPSTFKFAAAYAAWPKRPPRPFPPPFFSKPSGSFSDPLSDPQASRVHGEVMLGVTNGDDAVVVRDDFLAVMDGVGAWSVKENGCAGLWSRLVGHFWAKELEQGEEEPMEALERAMQKVTGVLAGEDGWLGTTTASSALLRRGAEAEKQAEVWVTQLGDCQVLVLRDGAGEKGSGGVVYASQEQWHYFDCPRQLGTNSPDTPRENAVVDVVTVVEGDLVLVLSDGVTDNLWEHEIARCVFKALGEWEAKGKVDDVQQGMKFAARELVLAARTIAEDPFAESPFMEKAVEEGLAIEGGKKDDISVVVARVVKREKGDTG